MVKSRKVTVALDVMGGDLGPEEAVVAAKKALKAFDFLSVLLVGDEVQLSVLVKKHRLLAFKRCRVVHADDVISMEDSPVWCFRHKPDASMRVALSLVADGVADVCVSPGNTGALSVLSYFLLGRWDGVLRPALLTFLPTLQGSTVLLDVGANVESKPQQLCDFAQMGAALSFSASGIQSPRVGLLFFV